jgi:YHS domain-containing protein
MAGFNRADLRLSVLGLLMAVVLFIILSPQVLAGDSKKKINTNRLGIAIKGYDTVAYFTEGRPVKGKEEFEYEWQGARWRFASAANRDKFKADPQAYAPKYGGF